jgi:hypothetical protein
MGAAVVGTWELLAVVTTTATTTGTTRAATTTLVQAAGGQGDTSVWIPLVAALLGALVGGMATLVASVLVKRWELRMATRIRMYDELLPAPLEQYQGIVMAMHVFLERGEWSPSPPRMELLEDAGELRRAGLIVGGTEAQITDRIWTLLRDHTATELGPGGSYLRWEPNETQAIRAVYEELESLTRGLHKHLERKLTSGFRRHSRGYGRA